MGWEMASQPCLFCICRKCIPSGPRNFFCPLCKATFDPKDDGEKGGNHERRAISKEEFELRQKQRGMSRRYPA